MTATASPVGPNLPGLRFIKHLGSGGFADVYLYERENMDLKVAVKVLKRDALTDAQLRQFRNEARTMAMLVNHPSIVQVMDSGTSPDGDPYIVMRYYSRSDLATRVAVSPLSVQEALRYGVQLASAVEVAHRAGVLHRDIKPSNILLDEYNRMGLSDFGIAGRSGKLEDGRELAISLPWSPREIVLVESDGSAQSDIYSLAATIWHLLVGHAPFADVGVPGSTNQRNELSRRIANDPRPPTRRVDVPPQLDQLLQTAMAKNPEHRPQTALHLARLFQGIEQSMHFPVTALEVPEEPSGPISATESVTSSSSAGSGTATSGRSPSGSEELRTVQKGFSVVDAQPRAPQLAASPPLVSKAAAEEPGLAPTAEPMPVVHPQPPGPRDLDRPVESTPEPGKPSRAKIYGGVAVGVLLTVAVVVGIMLTRAGGHKSSGGVPHPPLDTSIEGIGGVTNQPPPIPGKPKATIRAGMVIFRWVAVVGADSYEWRYSDGLPGGSSVKPRTMVRLASGTATCIEVASVADGQLSGWSADGCAS